MHHVMKQPFSFLSILCLPVGCMSAPDPRSEPVPATLLKSSQSDGTVRATTSTCQPFTCTPVTPSDPLITDFRDVSADGVFVDGDSYTGRPPDWWQRFYGSPYVYPNGPDALTQVMEGEWRIVGTVGDWSGFGLWFGACTVNLSAYRGVSFRVHGDAGPTGAVTLFVNTGPNAAPEPCRTNVGSCDAGSGPCRQPSTRVMVTSEPRDVTVLFEEVTGGEPMPSPDPAKILQLHFALDWTDYEGQRSEPYAVSLVLDDFRLHP